MLSQKMTDQLNEQINLEMFSSNLYLQMSAWSLSKGLVGCGAFFRQHATKELGHMQRLFDYVNETGAMAVLRATKAPPSEFTSILDAFKTTLEHERFITHEINCLLNAAFDERDFSTFKFLQWYVSEQHEEEHLFQSILDKISQIGTEGRGLFFIDKEMGNLKEKI